MKQRFLCVRGKLWSPADGFPAFLTTAAADEAKGSVATARGNSLCATPCVQECRQAGAMNRAPTSLTAGICLHFYPQLMRNAG